MTPHPFSIKLDQTSVVPLNEQLTKALQEEIRHRLQPGDRLPASRILAECLGISRNTVTAAYKRLVDEGWCDARVGSGTCVAEHLPLRERRDPRTGRPPTETSSLPELSERAQLALCAAQFHVQTEEPLAVAAPDYDSLPGKKWTQIVARISKSPWMHNSYCHPGGWGPFRRVLADHLRSARGISCDPEQIIITSGIQQGLALCAQILFNPGDAVAHEDPGFEVHRSTLRYWGLRPAPVPVDAEGLCVEQLSAFPEVRGVLVTPSHQYPLGMLMSRQRREALIRWASAHKAWIIEDDYDNVLSYAGSPTTALAAIAEIQSSVVYLGSFSKMIYPGFGLGYLVAPKSAAKAFEGAKLLSDRHESEVHQTILTEFISGGFYDAHVRRLKVLYAKRRNAAIRAIGRFLGDIGHLTIDNQGTHLCFCFEKALDDVHLADYLRREHRLETRALSPCFADAPKEYGLILGFAGFSEVQLENAVEELSRGIRSFLRTSN